MSDRSVDSAASEYVVMHQATIAADSPEEAGRLAVEMWQRADPEECRVASVNAIADALRFYADPASYFAIAIIPDKPSGEFADDVGCVIGPHGDHDHRNGRQARKALGDEWWGTEPCEDMLKAIADGRLPK